MFTSHGKPTIACSKFADSEHMGWTNARPYGPFQTSIPDAWEEEKTPICGVSSNRHHEISTACNLVTAKMSPSNVSKMLSDMQLQWDSMREEESQEYSPAVLTGAMAAQERLTVIMSTKRREKMKTEDSVSVRIFLPRHIQPNVNKQITLDTNAHYINAHEWFEYKESMSDVSKIGECWTRIEKSCRTTETSKAATLYVPKESPACQLTPFSEHSAHTPHFVHIHLYATRPNSKGQPCQHCVGYGLVPLEKWLLDPQYDSVLVPITNVGNASRYWMQALVHIVRDNTAPRNIPAWVHTTWRPAAPTPTTSEKELSLSLRSAFYQMNPLLRHSVMHQYILECHCCYSPPVDRDEYFKADLPGNGAVSVQFRRTMIDSRMHGRIPVYFPLYEPLMSEPTPSHYSFWDAILCEICSWHNWTVHGFVKAVEEWRAVPRGKTQPFPHVKASIRANDDEGDIHEPTFTPEDQRNRRYAHTMASLSEIYAQVIMWFSHTCPYLEDQTCKQDNQVVTYDQWMSPRTMPRRDKAACDCEDTVIEAITVHREWQDPSWEKSSSAGCRALHTLSLHYCLMATDASIVTKIGQMGEDARVMFLKQNPVCDVYTPNSGIGLHLFCLLVPWALVTPFLHDLRGAPTHDYTRAIPDDVLRRSTSLPPAYVDGTISFMGSYGRPLQQDTYEWEIQSLNTQNCLAESPKEDGETDEEAKEQDKKERRGPVSSDTLCSLWNRVRPTVNRTPLEMFFMRFSYRMLIAAYPVDLFRLSGIATLTPMVRLTNSYGRHIEAQGIPHQDWREWSLESLPRIAYVMDSQDNNGTEDWDWGALQDENPFWWCITDAHPRGEDTHHYLAGAPAGYEAGTSIQQWFHEYIDNRPLLPALQPAPIKPIGEQIVYRFMQRDNACPPVEQWPVVIRLGRQSNQSVDVTLILKEVDKRMASLKLYAGSVDLVRVPISEETELICVHYYPLDVLKKRKVGIASRDEEAKQRQYQKEGGPITQSTRACFDDAPVFALSASEDWFNILKSTL
jgi:hypothetical protein